eukprot:272440_1
MSQAEDSKSNTDTDTSWLQTKAGLVPWDIEQYVLTDQDFDRVIPNRADRIRQIQTITARESPEGIYNEQTWTADKIPISTTQQVVDLLDDISFRSNDANIKLFLLSYAFEGRVMFNKTIYCFMLWNGINWCYATGKSGVDFLRLLARVWRPFYEDLWKLLCVAVKDASQTAAYRQNIKQLTNILKKPKVKKMFGASDYNDKVIESTLRELVDNKPDTFWKQHPEVIPFATGCVYNVCQPGIFAPGILTDYVTGNNGAEFVEDLAAYFDHNETICLLFNKFEFDYANNDVGVYCYIQLFEGHGMNNIPAPKVGFMSVDLGGSGKTLKKGMLRNATGERGADLPRECWVGSEKVGQEFSNALWQVRTCSILILDEGSTNDVKSKSSTANAMKLKLLINDKASTIKHKTSSGEIVSVANNASIISFANSGNVQAFDPAVGDRFACHFPKHTTKRILKSDHFVQIEPDLVMQDVLLTDVAANLKATLMAHWAAVGLCKRALLKVQNAPIAIQDHTNMFIEACENQQPLFSAQPITVETTTNPQQNTTCDFIKYIAYEYGSKQIIDGSDLVKLNMGYEAILQLDSTLDSILQQEVQSRNKKSVFKKIRSQDIVVNKKKNKRSNIDANVVLINTTHSGRQKFVTQSCDDKPTPFKLKASSILFDEMLAIVGLNNTNKKERRKNHNEKTEKEDSESDVDNNIQQGYYNIQQVDNNNKNNKENDNNNNKESDNNNNKENEPKVADIVGGVYKYHSVMQPIIRLIKDGATRYVPVNHKLNNNVNQWLFIQHNGSNVWMTESQANKLTAGDLKTKGDICLLVKYQKCIATKDGDVCWVQKFAEKQRIKYLWEIQEAYLLWNSEHIKGRVGGVYALQYATIQQLNDTKVEAIKFKHQAN